MKEILLSVKPKYANEILHGNKWWEFRKSIPKVPSGTTVYIYATHPICKVVGFFTLGEVIFGDVLTLYKRTYKHAGITLEELQKYADTRLNIYAWEILWPKYYKTPKSLKDFEVSRAPQSYCFIYK